MLIRFRFVRHLIAIAGALALLRGVSDTPSSAESPEFRAAVETAQSTFTEPTLGLSLTYSSNFIPVKVDRNQVLLLIKPKTDDFPTFNLVVQPGPYPPNRFSSLRLEQEVVASYHAVGLTDAKIVGAANRVTPNGETFGYELSYSNAGQPFRSRVEILGRNDWHLIMTFIAPTSEYERYANYAQPLFDGVSLVRSDSASAPPPHRSYLPLLLPLLSALTVFAIVMRRRRKSQAERTQKPNSV